MNHTLCDACFAKLERQEEKTCAHGYCGGTCVRCGATQSAPLHCLGTMREDAQSPEQSRALVKAEGATNE